MSIGSNRRLSTRTAFRDPASVVMPDGTLREVRMWDLGTDGASLVSPKPIPQGISFELIFDLPGRAGPIHVVLRAKAVYSSYMAASQFRIGAIFVDLGAAEAAAIAEFISPP
jgi:hypothetical protein